MSGSDLQAMWRAARRLGARAGSRKPLPPLLFFTDPRRAPHPEQVIARLPRGSAVVFRAFGARGALIQGRDLARLGRRRGLVFLVGSDARLAVRLGADGIHLPECLAGRAGTIAALRRRFLVTAAAHDLPAALRARRAGVDAVVVSTVFASASPSAGKPLGALRFAALIRHAGAPAYALGGVNARTIRRLKNSGAVGVAAMGGLMGDSLPPLGEVRPKAGKGAGPGAVVAGRAPFGASRMVSPRGGREGRPAERRPRT